jgi:hypothetical protein
MRLSRSQTNADAVVASSGASRNASTRWSLSVAATGSDPDPIVLLSARRPEADPLTLHLIEMHTRIVFGDRKSKGRDVEPADR